jgi:predicted HNH restriction endonuclease
MRNWRFDQGRLQYFQFDEIKKIALALNALDGVKKPASDEKDVVREVLSKFSKLPFLPNDYTLWRNYGRVFEVMLLATSSNDHIFVTNLCKSIANNPDDLDSDDYLAYFSQNFYYSSPIFADYESTAPRVYPCLGIIKFLIAEFIVKGKDYVTIDEICMFLVPNVVTGHEDLQFFSRLKPSNYTDDPRQVRELVRFISQFSFLKWENPKLFIEVRDKTELLVIEKLMSPRISQIFTDRTAAILDMGAGISTTTTPFGSVTLTAHDHDDVEFTEGAKIRVTHIRAERSNKLRNFYFKKIPHAHVCRMCQLDTAKKYPWTAHVIEIHHLLPLSSPIRVEKNITSLKDLVGLCPSCHRAIHKFYSKWFTKMNMKDFSSYEQAMDVYNFAKSQVKN